MEELEGIHGAEGGRDPEFHKIPTQGSSHTSQATYIRAPSQGLPTTTTSNQIFESPNKFNTGNTPALTILFKMLEQVYNTDHTSVYLCDKNSYNFL